MTSTPSASRLSRAPPSAYWRVPPGIRAIGRALAFAAGLESRHAATQVDRSLSNKGIEVWQLFGRWVPFVFGDQQETVAALDWTEHDAGDRSTLVLSMTTSHGRATPLL
jgi:hypothetical protein